MGFTLGMPRWINIGKEIDTIHHISMLKKRDYTIILIDEGKVLNKIQLYFIMKTQQTEQKGASFACQRTPIKATGSITVNRRLGVSPTTRSKEYRAS
jgi:hypothetical protein